MTRMMMTDCQCLSELTPRQHQNHLSPNKNREHHSHDRDRSPHQHHRRPHQQPQHSPDMQRRKQPRKVRATTTAWISSPRRSAPAGAAFPRQHIRAAQCTQLAVWRVFQ